MSEDSAEAVMGPAPYPSALAGATAGADCPERPVWGQKTDELFYLAEPGRLVSVPVQIGERFAFGSATEAFNGQYLSSGVNRSYDVTPDGQQFSMIKAAQDTPDVRQAQVVVVQHWTEELKRLVPVN